MNKKMIIPITIGVALVGTLVYFLNKALKNPAPVTDGGSPIKPPIDGGSGGFDAGGYGQDTGGDVPGFSVTTKSGTRLRSEPNTSSTILKTYNSGYIMKVTGQSNESDGLWYRVVDSNTLQTGWMRSDVVV